MSQAPKDPRQIAYEQQREVHRIAYSLPRGGAGRTVGVKIAELFVETPEELADELPDEA